MRSGWRVALWLGSVIAVLVLASIAGVGRLPLTVAHTVRLMLVALVSLLAWRVLEGRPPRRTWLAVDSTAGRRFGLGLLAGVLLAGLALLPVALSGSLEILSRDCRIEQQGGFLLTTAAFFLVAAALEEALFRGYPLFALESGPGPIVAVTVTSVVFSLLHAANPHFDEVAAVVLLGVGAVLAVSVLQTRGLWEAVGTHLGWNWALGSGAALPVSGLAMPSPCYSGALSGSAWLTGGGFGLEAGMAGAGAWTVAAIALWLRGRRDERVGPGS